MTTLTPEAKKWILAQAKEFKINPVGKKHEALLELVSKYREDGSTEVTLWIAQGNCVTELPGFEGIRPLPNRREQSAGGKTVKKAPRRVARKEPGEKAEPKKLKAGFPVVVKLSEVLEEMGVEGRIARRKLRGSDIQKPGSSWEWPMGHGDIQKVRDLLK